MAIEGHKQLTKLQSEGCNLRPKHSPLGEFLKTFIHLGEGFIYMI